MIFTFIFTVRIALYSYADDCGVCVSIYIYICIYIYIYASTLETLLEDDVIYKI